MAHGAGVALRPWESAATSRRATAPPSCGSGSSSWSPSGRWRASPDPTPTLPTWPTSRPTSSPPPRATSASPSPRSPRCVRSSPARSRAEAAGRRARLAVMRRYNLNEPDFTDDADDPDGFRTAYDKIGPKVGGEKLGATHYLVRAGQSLCPYHYEY